MTGEAATTIGYFWAAVLGMIQGLAEFLPVSSSGHLALVEHLGLGREASPSFDIFLHLATLIVVLVYFRTSILWYYKNDRQVLLFVIIATIPAGIIGLAGKKYFEALRQSPTMVCVGLLVTAGILCAAELVRGAGYQLRDLGVHGSLVVGLCQALALAAGVSRSGMTISGAMICGVDREEAFRFSFMLSVPAVAGAAVLQLLHQLSSGGAAGLWQTIEVGPYLLGFVLALGSGYIALVCLERIIAAGKLVWCAAYCCFAAAAGLLYFNFFVW